MAAILFSVFVANKVMNYRENIVTIKPSNQPIKEGRRQKMSDLS